MLLLLIPCPRKLGATQGNRNTGTLVGGGPWERNDGAPGIAFDNPGGITFDGIGQHIIAGDGAGTGISLSGRPFTIAFWAKRTKSGEQWIVSQGYGLEAKGLHVGFRDNTTFTLGFWNDDLNVTIPADNEWHHWAVTFDPPTNVQQVYRDGALVGHRVSKKDLQSSGYLNIGRRFDRTGYFVPVWTAAVAWVFTWAVLGTGDTWRWSSGLCRSA